MEPVSGRDRFRKYKSGIRVLTRLVSLAPVRVRTSLLTWSQWVPGIGGTGLRYCLVRSLARSCGDNVLIGPNVELRRIERLSIGDNVSIHRGCYIDAEGEVTIGNDVSIAHATSILSFDHTWDDPTVPIKYNPTVLRPVRIDDDVWIGCGCRILAGVRVESRSIVAAGAVVTKDVPAGRLVGGVPAKVLRTITPAVPGAQSA